MGKLYHIIAACFILVLGCKPETPTNPNKHPVLTGNITADVNNLLPEGEITVDVMDGIKRDMRLAELQTKYQQGAREHYDWYVEYIKNYNLGEPIPYHENFGMTTEEFQERQDRINKITFYSTGLQKIQIIKENGIIRFKADKKLKNFENVRFNLKKNTAHIGDYALQFADSIHINNTNNGFRSKWRGYVWTYENPKDIHLEALKNITGLNVVQYKITLGQLENGDALLILKATEVEQGIILFDMDLPIII